MVDVLKVANYSKEPSFSLSIDELINIVGSNGEVREMYQEGVLDTGMEIYDGVSDCTSKYIAMKVEKPNLLVDFFKYLINSYTKSLDLAGKRYTLGLSYISIVSEEDGSISVYLDCTERVIKILISSSEDGLKVLSGSNYLISEIDFLGKLQSVLFWVSEVCPLPVNSIEYHVSWGIDTLEDIGEGSLYYMGFAEAVNENSFLHDVNVKGEYVVSFLEVV